MLNRSIQAKLFMSLGVLVAGFIFLIATVIWGAFHTRDFVDRSSRELFPAALSAQHAQAAFEKAIKHFQDAVILQDPRNLATADKELGDTLDTLAALLQQTPEQGSQNMLARRTRIHAATSSIAALRSQASVTYPALIQNPEHAPEDVLRSVADLARSSHGIDTELDALRADAAADLTTRLAQMSLWSQREQTFSIVLLLVALI